MGGMNLLPTAALGRVSDLDPLTVVLDGADTGMPAGMIDTLTPQVDQRVLVAWTGAALYILGGVLPPGSSGGIPVDDQGDVDYPGDPGDADEEPVVNSGMYYVTYNDSSGSPAYTLLWTDSINIPDNPAGGDTGLWQNICNPEGTSYYIFPNATPPDFTNSGGLDATVIDEFYGPAGGQPWWGLTLMFIDQTPDSVSPYVTSGGYDLTCRSLVPIEQQADPSWRLYEAWYYAPLAGGDRAWRHIFREDTYQDLPLPTAVHGAGDDMFYLCSDPTVFNGMDTAPTSAPDMTVFQQAPMVNSFVDGLFIYDDQLTPGDPATPDPYPLDWFTPGPLRTWGPDDLRPL